MSSNEEGTTKVNCDCDQVSIHSTRSACSNEDIGDPPIQPNPTKWRKRFILLCALIFGIIIPAAIGTFVMLWWLEAYERTVTGMMTSMQNDLKIMANWTALRNESDNAIKSKAQEIYELAMAEN